MRRVITTRSPEQTHALGRRLAPKLMPPDVVCLIGPLGAGKTLLVQGLAKGLGLRFRRVMFPQENAPLRLAVRFRMAQRIRDFPPHGCL